ncbi:MAG: exosortase/archaeosortase family protein [Sphingobium sp.]
MVSTSIAGPPPTGPAWTARPAQRDGRQVALAFGLVVLGLLALYVPVLWQYGARYFWDEDDNHSGVLLALVLFGYWTDRAAFRRDATRWEEQGGIACILAGLAFYAVGRVTDLLQLQGASLPVIVTGLTLATGGLRLVRRWWLLSILLIFIVPWFGPIADVLLVPLRLALTEMAARFTSFLGFPVSSSGVFIYVGFIQLNVAGACVGLRAMVSMTAIGFLFLHFFPPRSPAAGLLFIILLPVIALTANFIRVSGLVITAALFGVSGEAVVHDAAAYMEVGVALLAFLILGKALGARTQDA